ncbi:hypothetical protein SAMN02910418_00873 [Bowdeniella nasicola]|uniref:Uncharacterized protein n=1 Tax=Bowdeniella nasicola TaxID=208480 RepID=A0A1H3Y6K0_9ACTO|nr:hypothetical protein [Bowdeniella nasicola]SEA07183.1 hypothetical protein SAMN02910418_00873 [Bowdeniella nasicola]
MAKGTGRRWIPLLGAIILWLGIAFTVLMVAVVIYNVVNGDPVSWVVFPIALGLNLLGYVLIRFSGERFGDVMNTWTG